MFIHHDSSFVPPDFSRHYLRDQKAKPDECFDRDWGLGKASECFQAEEVYEEYEDYEAAHLSLKDN